MKRFFSNAGWLVTEQVGVNLIGLGVMVALARGLGPADYGAYAYVMSLALLAGTLGTMGLDGVLMRELVQKPDAGGETMGTVMALRTAGYGVGAVALLLFALGQPQHGPGERALFGFVAAALLLAAVVPMLATWLRARELARPAALAALAAALAGGAGKLAAVSLGLPALGAVHLAAAVLGLALAWIGYRAHGGPGAAKWRFAGDRARGLLGESLILFLGGLLATAYMNMDVVMLRLLLGAEAAGIYAVPARLVQAANVLAAAVSLAVFPRLIAAHGRRDGSFERQLRLGFSAMSAMAYALLLAAATLGGPVVALVFGAEWAETGPLLLLLAVTLPMSFMRYLVTRWVILAGQGRYLMASEAVGATLNLLLNLLLIPSMGAVGAALATIAGFVVAGPVSLLLWPQGRSIGRLMVVSLLDPFSPLWRWRRDTLLRKAK